MQFSSIKPFSREDSQLKTINSLLSDSSLKPTDRMQLLYALAKIQEDLRDYPASYKALEEANKIRAGELNYQLSEDKKKFAEIKKSFKDRAQVKPTKTKTPTQEMTKCIAELFIKMFTILARMIPIKPMIKKEPNLVKSLLVV